MKETKEDNEVKLALNVHVDQPREWVFFRKICIPFSFGEVMALMILLACEEIHPPLSVTTRNGHSDLPEAQGLNKRKEDNKQASADVLFHYSRFALACIGCKIRPFNLRLHLMKEISGMPSSLNRESPQNAASPDPMGESSSTGTARLDRGDSHSLLQSTSFFPSSPLYSGFAVYSFKPLSDCSSLFFSSRRSIRSIQFQTSIAIYHITMQDMWNAPPGFRPSKSAPSSPAKPLGAVLRTRSESFHVTHKVPVGDTPYVRAKNVQLVDKDPERAIPLFWAAINAGDRVDSALKDMAIVMKQQNRAGEAIEAIKSLRSRCSDQAQESLDNILLDLYKRCGRLDDQIALLKHKLYLIQQGLAFNGKRTKTARSQGKKFQVSVEQEATRLLGNLGWALMQQNNYIEAEEAYRRALSIAPDNNKMCNLGICLMKQGRIGEAKETLYRVKPAVMDGPRGSDSHLKAYERAQQMLKDLESEMMNKGVDRIEQSRLFEAFLGSSSIWQPQPCKDHHTTLPAATNSAKFRDDFADENINSNIMTKNHTALPPSKAITTTNKHVVAMLGNSLNVAAPPFYASKPMLREPVENQFSETLKRTRSGNVAGSMRAVSDVRESNNKLHVELGVPVPGNKTRRLSSEAGEKNKLTDLLPDDNDFEEAILAAILGPSNDSKATETSRILQRNSDKRLKVFEDITLSLSPRA
ncbi:unnamed protein product [Sphenostylis stenocarpa]|uniref:Protein POLLENLESS 3-LIKE 2 n=1 Tax=Sphenostylis stenocarpa TaxID=92480 RepID=A0AA86SG03_9FABA|nr:unnamed protein product [Sphenostylis stenocarpa]